MDFNATYQGKVYQMTGGVVYDLIDGTFRGTSVEQQTYRVVLTGYTAISTRGSLGYQTTSGGYIILSEGWQQIGTVAIAQYSQTQAQALVQKIIENNKIITRCNLLCARYASRFTEEQQAAIRELQRRVYARNAALQNEGLTKDVQTGYPTEYAELSGYLDALMSGEPIGIATWVVVVIAATVIAATATAAYFAYKAYADESEQDVKYSKELTKILTSKLTEDEYNQLLQETKGIVTKARIKQALSSSSKWLLIAGAVIAGAFIGRAIKNRF